MSFACDDPYGPAESSGTAYLLTPHACRHCGGRVLRSGDTYRCSGCAVVTMGAPEGICGCGVLASWGSKPPRTREPKAPTKAPEVSHWKGPRPFRCMLNPDRSAKNPSEVVIAFGDADAAAA